MLVLVIDDLRVFPTLEQEHEVAYARNPNEGIQLINQYDHIDLLLLDHDLGLHPVSQEPWTIGTVVNHLIERKIFGPSIFIDEIHMISANPSPNIDAMVLGLSNRFPSVHRTHASEFNGFVPSHD